MNRPLIFCQAILPGAKLPASANHQGFPSLLIELINDE
jgi:hypothetical protein